jgi:hypothetical protein
MTMLCPQQLVHTLLEEWAALLEDRIDDLIKQYPKARFTRQQLEMLAQYDPTQHKKYLPWMAKQAANAQIIAHPDMLDGLRDQLMTFERLLAIPAFEGNRDIFSYDWKSFYDTMRANEQLRSRSEQDRATKLAKKTKEVSQYEHQKGVTEVGNVGNLSLLKITDAESLSWWAWRGYMQENPNWNRPTLQPPPPGQDLYGHDQKWCVRNPSHGSNYLRSEPFYLVLKNGWPYVGILLAGGQVKNLDNHQVDMGVAEEIYPLLEPIINQMKADEETLGYEARIFENMRFLSGGVQPGEKFSSDMDLSGSSLAKLPENLTFSDSLNVSSTMLTELPAGLTVKRNLNASGTPIAKIGDSLGVTGSLNLSGTKITSLPEGLTCKTLNVSNTAITELPNGLSLTKLGIEGTQITKLPNDLEVERMTWSEPLTLEECKRLFFRQNLERMKNEFLAHKKFSGLSKQVMATKWKKFQPEMLRYYLTDAAVEGHVKSLYVYTKPGKISKEEE